MHSSQVTWNILRGILQGPPCKAVPVWGPLRPWVLGVWWDLGYWTLRSKITWRLLPDCSLSGGPSFLPGALCKQPMSSPECSLFYRVFYCNTFSAPMSQCSLPIPSTLDLGFDPQQEQQSQTTRVWLSKLDLDSMSKSSFLFVRVWFLSGFLALRRQCGCWLSVKAFLGLDVC